MAVLGCATAVLCPNPKVLAVALICHYTGEEGTRLLCIQPLGVVSHCFVLPSLGYTVVEALATPRRLWHWPPIRSALLSPAPPPGGPELGLWPTTPRASWYCTLPHPWAKDTAVTCHPRPVLLLVSPTHTHCKCVHIHTHTEAKTTALSPRDADPVP